MKEHKEISALLLRAETEQRCAYGRNHAQRQALRRRLMAGELVSPYCNLYMRCAYWQGLDVEQRSMHTIRALAKMHPQWVFASLSAACAYGLQHPFTMHNGMVYIASDKSPGSKKDERHLQRIYMNQIPVKECGELLVTTPVRTLLDCAMFPFPQALAMYDSALRMQLTTVDEIQQAATQYVCYEQAVGRLLTYTDPRSENGGESLMRGVAMERCFMRPTLQMEFDNPDNPSMPYRVDCCWQLADGRIIVAEFDGMAKYADASNQSRASIQAKLEYERRRENHLKSQGVTAIVHIFFEDVVTPGRLESKLLCAGVPKTR
ncbi:hypothetical protein JS530_09975 [Bifidobacterium sp. LC6]|uniref:CTP synthase n=1 Tax=Bifidobacterium colobi TaxID=2809026 RepID=A0ABS5UZD7_9BIFI|nr:hypothetical protein [Bifidobacterium colobi]MBT1175819.1 hypothetical protein [Bifidobacterium colobi]